MATAVATNSDARSAAVVLGAHGLDALFDTVVTVDLVSGPKPNPEMIHLTIERLGVPAGQVVFVGDSPGDMIAARAAGVLAVAAGWGHQTPGIPREDIDVLARPPPTSRASSWAGPELQVATNLGFPRPLPWSRLAMHAWPGGVVPIMGRVERDRDGGLGPRGTTPPAAQAATPPDQHGRLAVHDHPVDAG